MSVDKALREMIREEIETKLGAELESLRDLASRLSPLTRLIGGGAPARRGPGRPAGSGRRPTSARRGRRVRAESGSNDRLCALSGCKNKARSKGYCAAHYQKYRNLSRTNRLPSDWKEYAAPNSVSDIVLPRGRAAAKALKEAKGR